MSKHIELNSKDYILSMLATIFPFNLPKLFKFNDENRKRFNVFQKAKMRVY